MEPDAEEGFPMFEVYCPAHGTHVLLTTIRILVLTPAADGIVVDWRCWCGHHGRSLEGRLAHDELPAAS
jgi:hypothetical protein